MTNPIDEKRLEELKAQIGGFHSCDCSEVPIFSMIETLSLALAVVRAAQHYRSTIKEPCRYLDEALAPFSQPRSDAGTQVNRPSYDCKCGFIVAVDELYCMNCGILRSSQGEKEKS